MLNPGEVQLKTQSMMISGDVPGYYLWTDRIPKCNQETIINPNYYHQSNTPANEDEDCYY